MRVLHVQYTSPGAYPPLVRGAELLVEAGAEVLMLGTRVAGLDVLDAQPRGDIQIRLMPAAGTGWRLKAHYARYAAWVAREGAVWKPDWIYASDLLSAPIALALHRLTGARVVYHEHDAPVIDQPSWTIRRCLAARHRLLRLATIVVTPNAERSAHLSALGGGRPVMTAWNCPLRPGDEAPPSRHSHGLGVLYRGSINAERLPATAVDAVARAGDDVTLTITGYETVGSRGHVASLHARARELGIESRVRSLGTVSEDEITRVATHSDVGLALMPIGSRDENMRHMIGASNKVFEYWSAGVVPLVSDLADWRATFVESGYALACDPRNADSIASALQWAATHRAELRTIAMRGWERLRADWNYETQFAPVLSAMLGDGSGVAAPGIAREAEVSCVS